MFHDQTAPSEVDCAFQENSVKLLADEELRQAIERTQRAKRGFQKARRAMFERFRILCATCKPEETAGALSLLAQLLADE